jgi:hypothetical protein
MVACLKSVIFWDMRADFRPFLQVALLQSLAIKVGLAQSHLSLLCPVYAPIWVPLHILVA